MNDFMYKCPKWRDAGEFLLKDLQQTQRAAAFSVLKKPGEVVQTLD